MAYTQQIKTCGAPLRGHSGEILPIHWNRNMPRLSSRKGIRMQGENMDDYITQFKHLACQARYHLDNPQMLDLFTQGLLDALYMKIYELYDPQDYEQWKQCTLDQQQQFIHVKAHLNHYKLAPAPHPSTNWGPRPNSGQPRFNVCDPNAMDTSPGWVCT